MTNDELKEKNKKIVEDFFRLCNVMGNEDDLATAISEHINREHRTTIQCFFKTISRVIVDYAKTGQCDLRNEDSLKWAKEVAKIDNGMRFI